MTEKHYLDAGTFLHDSWRLAAMVRNGGWKPDWLIGLWRGGAPVCVAMHEFLKVTGWSVNHLPLKCGSYTGIEANEGEVTFTLGDEVLGLIGKGQKVLVVDDVFDTGKTVEAVNRRMREQGIEARYACVYFKPEKNLTQLKPDYFVKDVGSDWIVFPHEIEGLTEDEIGEKDALLKTLIESTKAE